MTDSLISSPLAGDEQGGVVHVDTPFGNFVEAWDGFDMVSFADLEQGMKVFALNRWTDLGAELSIDSDTALYHVTPLDDVETPPAAEEPSSALEAALLEGNVLMNTTAIVGTDYADSFFGMDGDEYFSGGGGSDWFQGRGGNDTFDGGDGADIFALGDGSKTIYGGNGIDTLRLSGPVEDYRFTRLGNSSYQVESATGVSVLTGVERVQLTDLSYVAFEDVLDTGPEWDPEVQDLLAEADRAEGLDNPSVAVNLNDISDITTMDPFLDIMKYSRPFAASGNGVWKLYDHATLVEEGYLDENGWPVALPDDADQIVTVWGEPDYNPTMDGIYVLKYSGEGTLQLTGVTVLSETDGAIVFDYDGDGTILLAVTETDPDSTGDYIRDISIVKEEYIELHESGQIFNPEFLEVVQDFRQIRYMDIMSTNNSQVEDADDVMPETYATWSDGDLVIGSPREVIAELANQTGTDLWINIPVLASEDYIRELALFMRENVDPNLTITVEYGNETWNNSFHETMALRAAAQEAWGLESTDYAAFVAYTAKLSVETAQIFDQVFGDEADYRLVHTLGGSLPDTSRTEDLLTAEIWREYEHDNWVAPTEVMDAVAVTSYFGGWTLQKDYLLDELLEVIADPEVDAFVWLRDAMLDPDYPGSIPTVLANWKRQSELTERYGVDLLMYEGGAHIQQYFQVAADRELLEEQIVGFMEEFYRSDYMVELYEAVFEGWMEYGDGPFNQFGVVAQGDVYGFWSFLSNLQDDNARARFIYDQNAYVDAWWDGAEANASYQQGVNEIGTDGDDLLIGTREEDHLVGGAGNDTLVGGIGDNGLHGGEGNDTAVLTGVLDDYFVYRDGDGYSFRHADGSTYMIAVEQILFEDGSLVDITDIVGPAEDNTEPAALADSVTVLEDHDTVLTDLLLNDSDVDGDKIGILSATDGDHGHVAVAEDGTLTYMPDEDFVGTDSFTYVLTDGNATSEATVTVEVLNQPDAPDISVEEEQFLMDDHALGDILFTVEGSDLDGDTLTYSILSGNEAGLFGINAATGDVFAAADLSLPDEETQSMHEMVFAVSDGTFTTETSVQVEIQSDNRFVQHTDTGALIDGLLGDDLYVVDPEAEVGYTFRTISYWSPTFEDLAHQFLVPDSEASHVVSVYATGSSVIIDGEEVSAGYSSTHDGLDTALLLSNVVINVEGMQGTDYGDTYLGRGTSADVFYAMGGNDTIDTAEGDDVIVGGAGSDKITGGGGADRFVLDSLEGTDIIYDFDLLEGDTLDLSALLAEVDPGTGDIAEFVRLSDDGVDTTVSFSASGTAEHLLDVAILMNTAGLELGDIL